MLLNLVQKVLDGKDRVLRDSRSQIKVSRVNRQLIVYRYEGVQFWYDLDQGLRQFCMITNAEVRAYNKILELLKGEGQFIKSGPIVYYKKGDKLWKSSEWKTD